MPFRALAIVALALPALAADQFDSTRAFIRQRLTETSTPSLAVAVARDGKIIWQEGFGWADREKLIPANENTMYSLASVSKPITATGLMILVQNGKVALDKPINDYLGLSKIRADIGNAADATVRRVANHTSGLPVHAQFFYADEPFRRPSMDETIFRYGHLVRPPGEQYEYSNLGYGILDYVISRASGSNFQDFMREQVFRPLGLNRTSVDIGPGLEKYSAQRYDEDGLPIPFYDTDHRGATSVYASAHDVARFSMFHLKAHLPDQKAILSDASIDEMQKATVTTDEMPQAAGTTGASLGYGVGWGVSHRPDGYHTINHSGGMGGVSTNLRLFPAEKLAIVVLANSRCDDVTEEVSDRIAAVLLPKWKTVTPPGPKPTSPPSSLQGVWTGKLVTYKGEIPLKMAFFDLEDVHVQMGVGPPGLLLGLEWRNGAISGEILGDVGTEDANRRPYTIKLTLKLRGNVLSGPASAISHGGRRVGNELTYWVELNKEIRSEPHL
jgi:CubicO group peptidase (beta-lactamase class C family)